VCPLRSSHQSPRVSQLATESHTFNTWSRWERCPGYMGGDEGTRTPDPLDANQMLSQLSYAPRRQSDRIADHAIDVRVGLLRLERRTSVLSGLRSNQLSYRPADGKRWMISCANRRVRSNLRHDANRYISAMHSTTEMATMHLDLEVRSRKSPKRPPQPGYSLERR
jgi:hypothetical protein